MSQTFAAFKARLAKGVLRDDLVEGQGDHINEALREIQNRRSWTVMKDTATLSIPAGTGRQTVALPERFKELQRAPAVHYVTDEGGLVPADVVTEEQQAYRIWAFGGTPMTTWPPRLYFERRANGAVLGVMEPILQPMQFQVKCYRYLPDLAADGDTSPLIDAYPRMVLAKARSIAFTDINDDLAAQFEDAFEKFWADAVRQDAYAEVRGTTTRM